MACCLTVPSHYLNLISEVQWRSFDGKFSRYLSHQLLIQFLNQVWSHYQIIKETNIQPDTRIILWMGPANERRPNIVKLSHCLGEFTKWSLLTLQMHKYRLCYHSLLSLKHEPIQILERPLFLIIIMVYVSLKSLLELQPQYPVVWSSPNNSCEDRALVDEIFMNAWSSNQLQRLEDRAPGL